jgi:hypothetical protein
MSAVELEEDLRFSPGLGNLTLLELAPAVEAGVEEEEDMGWDVRAGHNL